MNRVKRKHRVQIYATSLAAAVIIVTGVAGGSCVFGTATNLCERIGLRCPAGQECAANQAVCIAIGSCGNGILDSGEVCDDGNTISGDGCRADCKSNEACGNGIIDTYLGEECEFSDRPFPHHFEDTAQCDNDCTLPVCGDGHHNTILEECDPGVMSNGTSMDSQTCDSDCTHVECGDSHINIPAGEECDNGASNSNSPNAECRTNCHKASCGDGIIDNDTHDPSHPNEMCDDGNDNTDDDCPSGPAGSCKPAICGDGFIQTNGSTPHELCDKGDSSKSIPAVGCISGFHCSNDCHSCDPDTVPDGIPDAM